MRTHAKKPKVLLFDLGGVIVRWVGIEQLAKLSGLTPEKVTSEISDCPIYQAYELGLCGDDIFARTVSDSFGLNMAVADFKALWNS